MEELNEIKFDLNHPHDMQTLACLTPHVYKPQQQYFNIAGLSVSNIAQSRAPRADITDLDVEDNIMLLHRPIT